MPVVLVLLGLVIISINPLSDPAAFTLNTSAYPGPQRMLYNTNPVVNSADTTSFYSPADVLANLPEADSYFSLTATDTAASYDDFYLQITE